MNICMNIDICMYVDVYISMYSSRLMNCSFMQIPIYTRGVGNACFWCEYMIILLHVMLHMIQYVVKCNVH